MPRGPEVAGLVGIVPAVLHLGMGASGLYPLSIYRSAQVRERRTDGSAQLLAWLWRFPALNQQQSGGSFPTPAAG